MTDLIASWLKPTGLRTKPHWINDKRDETMCGTPCNLDLMQKVEQSEVNLDEDIPEDLCGRCISVHKSLGDTGRQYRRSSKGRPGKGVISAHAMCVRSQHAPSTENAERLPVGSLTECKCGEFRYQKLGLNQWKVVQA